MVLVSGESEEESTVDENDGRVDKGVETRLLAIVLFLTLVISSGLLITFYNEITGKVSAATASSTVTGVLMGIFIITFLHRL